MFSRVVCIRCLLESARICPQNGNQYQKAVSNLPFPLPNSTSANPASRPRVKFPSSRSRGCHPACLKHEGQAERQPRERSSHECLVVSNLQPAPRPIPRSRNWFQIRHHQSKSRANDRRRFPYVFAANLAELSSVSTTMQLLRPGCPISVLARPPAWSVISSP